MDYEPETVGEAWVSLLKQRGVDMLFANAGTDFPSIVEGFARTEALGVPAPRPIICPHENAAVSMAHGYAAVTGRAQAVMVHVNVGTANSINGLINAERDYIPMLFAAGRTPILETGPHGARNSNIHWAQEMFDQAGMVRETVRWDYELREAAQLELMVDRALAITHSAPAGPVYVSLPREVLARPAAAVLSRMTRQDAARRIAPDPRAVAAAIAALSRASKPLIVTARSGSDQSVPQKLGELAERLGAPVVEYRPRYMNLSTAHSLHGGFESAPWLKDADVILVLDCDVPWIPSTDPVRPDALVIQAGDDPLHARYPMRGFPADITLRGSALLTIEALLAELDGAARSRGEARRGDMEAACSALRAKALKFSLQTPPEKMTKAWVSYCIDQVRAPDSILVNEYPLVRGVMEVTGPGSYYASSPSGGLGWGLPAALGVKLAAPERDVIAAIGDGCHIFANPIACHQISAAERIPIVTVICNNAHWGAVYQATQRMYPAGHAMRANRMPLTSLEPVPSYADIARACGWRGEAVTEANALVDALQRALESVRHDGRSALIDARVVD